MAERKRPGVRLKNLKIMGFKAFEEFEIGFPKPRMKDAPDVFVLGSRNGLGKTSVLESCALLLLGALFGEKLFEIAAHREMPVDFYDLLVRAGTEKATIAGTFTVGKTEKSLRVTLTRSGDFQAKGDVGSVRDQIVGDEWDFPGATERLLLSLSGLTPDPLVVPPLMYFHSYRKVKEGNPELGMMVETEPYSRRARFRRYPPWMEYPMSAFKLAILRSMMSRASLFEELDDEKADTTLEHLNELVRRYAGGTIEKLRPSPDNTVDFRISHPARDTSFSFDGLSSGQKEIISTLFMIWRYTLARPGIVLIDEPELHLNAEWHRDFVQQARSLAPDNQYILATHSQHVFESVEQDRRILLEEEEGEGQENG